jgi:hypothetical protein
MTMSSNPKKDEIASELRSLREGRNKTVSLPPSKNPPVKLNAAKCLTCGAIIESTHVHDFKYCRCPNEETQIFVDGGHEYVRRGFGSKARWWELGVTSYHDRHSELAPQKVEPE